MSIQTRAGADEPIRIAVDGEMVEGRISFLRFNDIRVEITSPFCRVAKSEHIAYFALPYIQYERDGVLTPRGRQSAEQLLKEICEECMFCEAHEEELVADCQNLLAEGTWCRFRTALARCDFSESWWTFPIFLGVFFFTDWVVVELCQDAVAEKFGRRLPEELVRRLLARARWLEDQC